MKKIAVTALLVSLALAACSNKEKDQVSETNKKPTNEQTVEKTEGQKPVTNTTSSPTTSTTSKKKVEILAITADEVDVFLKTIPHFDDYSFTVEEGTETYSAMLTSDTERKTAEIAKDSSVFKLIHTDGKEEFLDTYNAVQVVKAQRVLTEFIKGKDETWNVELTSIDSDNAHFEVYELVDKGEATEHRNHIDNALFDIANKTFQSEEDKMDYVAAHVE